jgi:cystathionine beta-lyase
MSGKRRATTLVDTEYRPPAGFGGLSAPVYHASTVTFKDVAAMRARDWRDNTGYTYGLHGTPTTFTLEQRIAELDGGRYTTLTPSGLAAIAMINFALLKTGDDLLLPNNVYGPSREMGRTLLADFGVTVRAYDPGCGGAIEGYLQPNTRLIWVESPGSVTMEVQDVPAITAVARRHSILTAIDNTWAAGILFHPFEHGVDLVMQALTKYPSGGSDMLMGSVTTRERALHERVRSAHMRLGLGVSGDDAFLIMRSLASLELRLRQHESAALLVARWLRARPEVARVLHPFFEDCPGHALWKRDFEGAGGLFSVVLRDEIAQERVDAMINALKIFRIGYSWGGSHSLAVPYLMHDLRTDPVWSAGSLVRLYIGLEDPLDLIDDLAQAITQLAG